MRIRLISNLLLISLSLTLLSCGAAVKGMALKNTTVEKNAIPSDFGKNNSTLLVGLSRKNARDKYLKKYFKENYHGPYVFVDSDKIDSELFKDTDSYRYIFDVDRRTDNKLKFNVFKKRFEPDGTTWNKYYVKDRQTGKYYYGQVESGFFAKLIEAYTINLEKTRKRNS